MFEFMNKYRVVILAALLLGLVGLGAWGAIQGLFGGPDNPVVGSLAIPGVSERVEVKAFEIGPLRRQLQRFGPYLRLKQYLGDDDLDQAAWCFIALRELGRSLGVNVSDAEIRQFMGVEDQNASPWRSDDEREWWRGFLTMARAHGLCFSDPGGVTYEELFERYKEEAPRLKVMYAAFEKKKPEDFPIDAEKEEGKKKLEEFAAANPKIGRDHKTEPKIDLEAVWVRFRGLPKEADTYDFDAEFEKTWKGMTADITPKEEELQARFQQQKRAYEGLAKTILAKEKKEKKDKGEETETGDQRSEYEVVKSRIEKELKVYALFLKFLDEVGTLDEEKAKSEDALAELAKKYGFKHGKRYKQTRLDYMRIEEFGSPQYVGMVFQAMNIHTNVGQLVKIKNPEGAGLLPRVCDQVTTSMALVRPFKFFPSRELKVSDDPQVFVKEWQKKQVEEDLENRSKGLVDKVKELVDARVKGKRDELMAEAQKKIAKEIDGLDPEKEDDKQRIGEIKTRYEQEVEALLLPERAKHEAEAFTAAAKDLDVRVETSAWLDASSMVTANYADDPLPDERDRRILRTSSYLETLKKLEVGRVAELHEAVQAQAIMASVLLEKKDPTIEDFHRAEGSPVMESLERQLSMPRMMYRLASDITYKNLKDKDWFDIVAPFTEKAIQDQKKAAEEGAERKRLRERQREARKKAAEAAREKRRLAAEKRKAEEKKAAEEKAAKEKAGEAGDPDKAKARDPDKAPVK